MKSIGFLEGVAVRTASVLAGVAACSAFTPSLERSLVPIPSQLMRLTACLASRARCTLRELIVLKCENGHAVVKSPRHLKVKVPHFYRAFVCLLPKLFSRLRLFNGYPKFPIALVFD